MEQRDPEAETHSHCQAQLEIRLHDLEGKVQRLAPPDKDAWDRLQIVASVLTPILGAIVGYYLITSVRLGFEQQQLQINSAEGMEHLITQMANPELTRDQVETTALGLAAFGKVAVLPLIQQLQSGDVNRVIAAQAGLLAVGPAEHDFTCANLSQVVRNRTQAYGWWAHRSVIRLLGSLDCVEALAALQDYETLLRSSSSPEGLSNYRQIVEEGRAPTLEDIKLLSADLARTLTILRSPTRSLGAGPSADGRRP